jgi:hypothetical protein
LNKDLIHLSLLGPVLLVPGAFPLLHEAADTLQDVSHQPHAPAFIHSFIQIAFILCCGTRIILGSRIRIRIKNEKPDPDPHRSEKQDSDRLSASIADFHDFDKDPDPN